jgi:hypothetical protein
MPSLNCEEIISAIVRGRFSGDELRALDSAVHDAYRNAARAAKRKFAVGDHVRFERRSGDVISGVVTRVCQKNLVVKPDGDGFRSWRVNPAVCSHC